MTYRGTNTYLLGHDQLTVIDPGPASDAHLAALLAAIAGRPVQQIVVTHSHLDHSPLAHPLSQATDAPILAFGNSTAGRSAVMTTLAQSGDLHGGEGIDADFAPDRRVSHGALIPTDITPLRVIHTPGHLGNHICLRWGDAIFSGDHVMGWASSLVSPPDGDLTDFMASCTGLLAENSAVLYPGHGAPVLDPAATIQALIAHRQHREAQILAALDGPKTAAEITAIIYVDIPPALHAAARRNVLAHLIDLTTQTRIQPLGPLSVTAQFDLIRPT
jgi:glyoxylase-like metal-dependent hydrolase (beta-lactamase superfamily II)